MMGENDEEEEEEEEDEEISEQPTAGDVFALEMVLNRETKKMMKASNIIRVFKAATSFFQVYVEASKRKKKI